MDKAIVISEGWFVEDMKLFRLLTDHQPPRPNIYRKQLWVDAKNWKPIALWVAGIGFSAAGLATSWRNHSFDGVFLLLLGLFCFHFWFACFRRVARDFRHGHTMLGVVEALLPHPLRGDCSTATILTADGGKVPIAFMAKLTRLIDEIHAAGARAEVFFLHTPLSQFSLGLAARPVNEAPHDPRDRPRE